MVLPVQTIEKTAERRKRKMGYPNSHHTPRSQHRSLLNCLNSLNIKGNINIKAFGDDPLKSAKTK